MNRLLVVLALVGAVPGGAQEACDMAQKPIAYPGAVLSRNAQIRAQALQASAYAQPPAWASARPTTLPDVYCTEGNLVLGSPNHAYVSRLKRSNTAPVTITGWTGNIGNNDIATRTMGMAVYEVRGAPHSDLASGGLFLVPGAWLFQPVVAGGYFAPGPFASNFEMESSKEYALAFFSESVQILDAVYAPIDATLLAGAGTSAMPQFPMGSSAWPNHVRFNRRDPGGDSDPFLSYGSSAILSFELTLDSKMVTIY